MAPTLTKLRRIIPTRLRVRLRSALGSARSSESVAARVKQLGPSGRLDSRKFVFRFPAPAYSVNLRLAPNSALKTEKAKILVVSSLGHGALDPRSGTSGWPYSGSVGTIYHYIPGEAGGSTLTELAFSSPVSHLEVELRHWQDKALRLDEVMPRLIAVARTGGQHPLFQYVVAEEA